MTSYSQSFAQADIADLDADLGFTTDNDGTTPLGIVELFNTFATNAVASAAVQAQQATTIPTTDEQRVRALVAFNTETPASGSDNHRIIVGLYSLADGASWGYGVRLTYANNSVRTLEIIRDDGTAITAGGSPTSVATVTLTTAQILSQSSSDLNVLQEIRLIATPVEGGTRVRAYVNEDDDDTPNLEYVDHRDSFDLTGSALGQWYFHFDEAPLRTLKVAEIHGDDIEEREPDDVQIKDRHNLGEIRANVLTRMDGSSTGTDRAGDTVFMNEIINSTVEEIITEVGDVAWFMQVVEELTFIPTVDRVVTLPTYIDRIFTIVDVEREFSAPWQFLGKLANEVSQIVFEKGYNAKGRRLRVHYQMKYQRMDVDADPCPIPRRYTETVVYGTIMRVAEFDTNDSLHAQTMARFQQKLRQMRQDMNRLNRTTKVKLQARRRVVHIPFGKHLTTPITGF